MTRLPENIDEVISAVAASGTADYAILLEAGWTRDPLTLTPWFNGVIQGTLEKIEATIPIILSCTSMPKILTPYDGGVSKVPFTNRFLFDQIRRRRSNRTRIIYGDWGVLDLVREEASEVVRWIE